MRMDFSSKMEQSITLYEHMVAKVILVYLPTILDRFSPLVLLQHKLSKGVWQGGKDKDNLQGW